MDTNPPAGWYADPLARFDHRYWDGAAWTEHVSRAGQPQRDPLDGWDPDTGTVADTGPTAWRPQPSASGPVNTLAVVSLVLSLTWVAGLGSLAGVITGMVARRQIREADGRQSGEAIALAGVVIGGVGLFLTLLALAGLVALFTFDTPTVTPS